MGAYVRSEGKAKYSIQGGGESVRVFRENVAREIDVGGGVEGIYRHTDDAS